MYIVEVNGVSRRTVGVVVDGRFDNLSGSVIFELYENWSQVFLTWKMTTAKDVKTSVNINTFSPFKASTSLDDLHLQGCDDTPWFKPFTL